MQKFSFLILFLICHLSFGQRLNDSLKHDFIDFAPEFHDSVIEQRFNAIDAEMSLSYNSKVRGFIDYFTIRNRDYTRKLLIKQSAYFPMFEAKLQAHNMPDDLKYLTIVESGINPIAQSPVGALGLWQFMPSTGKMYKLQYDAYIDERLDPEKSTEAACLYLKQLYNMFDDWELALAAYNCGPGNVRRAIRRSGYKKGFWNIYPYLPRETRSYVPQFMAINYVMRYPAEHNLEADYYDYMISTDTVHLEGYTNLEALSTNLGLCHDDIVKLNPEILKNIIPSSKKGYPLVLPAEQAIILRNNRDSLFKMSELRIAERDNYRRRKRVYTTSGKQRLTYRVRSGDVLGKIAERHHVRLSDLRRWNRIGRNNMIRVGQKLTIYSNSRGVTSTSTVLKNIPANKTHTVRSGDTLWSISKQYKGISIQQLKQLNGLSGSSLSIGQKIKLG